jgi:hypothetical protein
MHTMRIRQRIDLVTDLFPSAYRIQPQATLLVRVVGDDQTVFTFTRDEFTEGGWNCQPPLVVDRDCGLALEHLPADSPQIST